MLIRAFLACLVLVGQPAKAEIRIVLDPALDPTEAAFATKAIRTAEKIHLDTFGFDFSSNVRAVISADPDFLAREYTKHQGGNFAQKRKAFANWITGEATWRGVYVNVSQRGYNTRADTTLAVNRQRMYNHELFHIMQYELIGSRAKKCCPPNSSREVGPIWMMEGSASYFPRVLERRGLQNYLQFSRKKLRNLGGKTLAVLETRNGMNSVKNSYEIGAYAVYLLVEDYGTASVIGFYQGLRRSSDWKKVFNENFGEPVDQFYARFR